MEDQLDGIFREVDERRVGNQIIMSRFEAPPSGGFTVVSDIENGLIVKKSELLSTIDIFGRHSVRSYWSHQCYYNRYSPKY